MPMSTEHHALVAAAEAFVRREIKPHAADWDRNGTGTPQAVLENMGSAGYFGLLVPAAFGGAALDMTSYIAVTELFAAGDCGLCNLMNVCSSPVATAIRDHGTTAQKEHYLGALASGAARACFMLTEAEAGSDAAALRTRAQRTDEGYRISGSKQFVTAGDSAHFALLVAVTDPQAGKNGISTFLVPRTAWTVQRLEDKLGHRNCDTAAVHFDDALVGHDCLLGAEGDGYRIALAYLNGGRIGVGAQAVGVAQAALDAALEHAATRHTFGRPIIEHQAIGFRLAGMATRVTAARQLVRHAAALADAGEDAVAESAMAKAFASEVAEAVTSEAISVLGGYGYTRDHVVEKYFRDARVLSIYEGTNDIQNLVIARRLAADAAARG